MKVRRPSPAAVPVWTPVADQRMSHGRFADFTVYVPHGAPRGFVVFVSGPEGWTPALTDLSRRIAAHGVMVAGVDVVKFNAALESDGGQCVYPAGDLENLSHFVQAYFRLPSYLPPILAGYSTGGTLAYAALMQSPDNTFAGAVSVDFCPVYALKKPLCKGSGLESAARALGTGLELRASTLSGKAWSVLQTGTHLACDPETAGEFVANTAGVRLLALSAAGGSAASGDWEVPTVEAFDALLTKQPAAGESLPGALRDLPLVIVPAEPGAAANDTFAVILSGDGGWAGLDKDVAGALASAGIPVIGLDSLRYFWSPRTPAGLAADIDRLTRYYLPQLGKQRVLLIGYSQGADVLPFAVNHLSPETRAHLGLTVVMGMSEHAVFEFHMSNWLADDQSGAPTLPEMNKVIGTPLLCIYGEQETDTICPKLDPRKTTVVKLKGGHHFDGDYAALARVILSSAGPPR